jgi:L-ascorbate 6-phosphate lactonase
MMPLALRPRDVQGDLLLLTHDHMDHFDEETVRHAVLDKGITVAGPSSCYLHYSRLGLPADRYIVVDCNGTFEFNGIKISAIYADHTSGDGIRDAVGFVMRYANRTVYHVGDSELDSKIKKATNGMKPDLLFVPINGRWGNMNAREAASLSISTQALTAVPMHYGMFAENTADPAEFEFFLLKNGQQLCSISIPTLYHITLIGGLR